VGNKEAPWGSASTVFARGRQADPKTAAVAQRRELRLHHGDAEAQGRRRSREGKGHPPPLALSRRRLLIVPSSGLGTLGRRGHNDNRF
jgi:hypothetical protein